MSRKSEKDVLQAIRSVYESNARKPLSQAQFHKSTDITTSNIRYYFAKWSDACRAAGIEHDASRERIPDKELLEDWGTVTRQLGRIPSLIEYELHGKYTRNAFSRFIHIWADMPDAFKRAFAGIAGWEDVLALVERQVSRHNTEETIQEQKPTRSTGGRRWRGRLANRPTYGNPLDFRGLRHEPVNEQGVVFLFGMVARELGYLVESIQDGYPDCSAKREVEKGKWQDVSIEFEFDSRSFDTHNHNPESCDVIVCWNHNWKECPPDIEVLVLSEEIKKLR